MSAGWGRINGNAFRAQVSLDLSRAFALMQATTPERAILQYVMEQSWNRSVVRKRSASDPWPDALPTGVDLDFLAERLGIAAKALANALDRLRADRVLMEYKGGLTIDKNVDNWSHRRISRPALEFARSGQAVRHPGQNGSAYPPLCLHPPELPPNPTDPVGYLAEWMTGQFGKSLPPKQLAELASTGHHVAWISEAIGRSMDKASKRTVGGITRYAVRCLEDWKAAGKTSSAPEEFRPDVASPARSPPSNGHSKKDEAISQLFAKARANQPQEVEDDDDIDDEAEEEEAADCGGARRSD